MPEKTSFRMVFGDAPAVKILDFLIDNQEFDYSLTDIAKGAQIAWSTLHEYWPEFLRLGMVKQTRKVGRAELFKLDVTKLLVKKLLDLDTFISTEFVRQELEKQKVVA